jgi:hypothetical protein
VFSGKKSEGFAQCVVGSATVNPELREKGYVPCKGLVEASLARVLYRTLLLHQWRGETFRDNHIPTAESISNVAATDALLLEIRPRIESVAGCALVPTYSYARLYFHDDSLIRHHDRSACEVSVSIHLGHDGGEGSLWFSPNNRVPMDQGDGAIYLGHVTDHWRERFTGNTMAQIFLHYVIAGGSHAQDYFDGDAHRFPPSVSAGFR